MKNSFKKICMDGEGSLREFMGELDSELVLVDIETIEDWLMGTNQVFEGIFECCEGYYHYVDLIEATGYMDEFCGYCQVNVEELELNIAM